MQKAFVNFHIKMILNNLEPHAQDDSDEGGGDRQSIQNIRPVYTGAKVGVLRNV